AYAYALDHGLPLTVPDLVHNITDGIPYNAKRVFLKNIPSYTPQSPQPVIWKEPSFNYSPIDFAPRIELQGFFQSEKYFSHRRKELLKLFAASPDLIEQIKEKYPILSSNQLVVGVQIRDYSKESHIRPGEYHPTIQRSYYEKAVANFPKDTVFLVSSNNPKFAKECMEGIAMNVIYLQSDYIEEFYTLTLCKSFIISNSTFGWWAAWLSTAENKRVFAPNPWFAPPYDNKTMTKDLLPSYYEVIECAL
ncbi:MAG: alpha-1,2-fucosyltransferase, partial [Chlamydiae bacterium]|nr:alpha-1,2-fucosyltransferase [Chlamydiota bacterium]